MQSIRRTARVTRRRDVRVHGELWHTSRVLLEHGQERPQGSTHEFRASLVFTAFALEAYLKEQLGVRVDFGKRPWSIVTQIFGFRNDIAHGKLEVIEKSTVEAVDKHLDKKLGIVLPTEWESFCTEPNAVRARQDVEAIAQRLHDAAKFDSSESTYPFFMGFQSHSATLESIRQS